MTDRWVAVGFSYWAMKVRLTHDTLVCPAFILSTCDEQEIQTCYSSESIILAYDDVFKYFNDS